MGKDDSTECPSEIDPGASVGSKRPSDQAMTPAQWDHLWKTKYLPDFDRRHEAFWKEEMARVNSEHLAKQLETDLPEARVIPSRARL